MDGDAAQTSTESSAPEAEGSLKCAKCRSGVLAADWQYSGRDSHPSLWLLDPEDLPPWVLVSVEQSHWTKGRLICPNGDCNARVGSFDFVSGASDPAHLIRSKTDPSGARIIDPSLAEVLERREAAAAAAAAVLHPSIEEVLPSGLVENDSSTGREDGWSTPSSSFEHDDEESMDADVVELDFVVGERGDMRMVQQRTRRRRIRNKRKACRKKREASRSRGGKQREKSLIQDILEAEPELDAIDPNLICAVCLDLLYEPCSVVPCKHTFCETCLRRLGSKNAMHTLCPMCRQQIAFCEPQSDLAENIRHQYSDLYDKRKKLESSCNVHKLPLPWKPGWRNLISGRPLGGNRFNGQSTAELISRIVQQLPYYIPPVVLANLVNLVFFFILLFAVEIVPLFLGLFLKKPFKDTSHHQAKVVESLGQDVADEDLLAKAASGSGDVEHPSSLGFSEVIESPLVGLLPKSVVEPFSGEGIFPKPEDAAPAMDTTFYYAFYFVLLVVSFVGNFFLTYQHYQNPHEQRDGIWSRIINHPTLTRLSRVVVFACFVAFVCLPFLVLPSTSTARSESAVSYDGLKSILNALIQLMINISDVFTSFYGIPVIGSIIAFLF